MKVSMPVMTHRERALKTFDFQEVDKVAFDLMENTSWPEIDSFFADKYGLHSTSEILESCPRTYSSLG